MCVKMKGEEIMQEISLKLKQPALDFHMARDGALWIAKKHNPETFLVAWYDKRDDRHSPSITCEGGNRPGWEEYGANHGGKQKISVNRGDYVFIYT